MELKSNEFWGKRSGSIDKITGQRVFWQQQWGHGKENRGPKKRGAQYYINRQRRGRRVEE